MVTPDEIENRVFSLVRRGYDPAEVDAFLLEVASTLAQAQRGLATPPAVAVAAAEPAADPLAAPATEPVAGMAITGPDDFGRLGDEVAEILRQAHESVATMRHRAEADAALTRENAQREVEVLKAEADRDRQAAAVDLEAARAEAARILADVQAQSDRAAESAATTARSKAQEVVDLARGDARDAVFVQRNVRGRLEVARDDIDHALGNLVQEDEDLFAAIDLTDRAVEEARPEALDADGDVPPPGQGPPTPPVPPPTRTTPTALEDLPYASDDDDEDDDEDGAADDEVIDLTDSAREAAGDLAPANPFPLPPNPAPPVDDQARSEVLVPEGPDSESDPDDDGLAQMVKDAVENALRRRKNDGETPDGNGP